MSRDVFDVELGYAISVENGDRQVYIISGTAVPDGTSGKQQEAPIGSLYLRSGTGELYQKVANAGAPADYVLNGNASASIGNWRPERVDALTNDTLSAGSVNPTTWSDNDDGRAAADFTVGHYVIGDADGTPALFEITAISAPNITLAAAGTPIADDDMFAIKYYMPDPAGQENQAIATFDGSVMVKVADVDFGSATAINLVAPYTPGSGDVTASDSVQSAIQKLDGNNDAQDSLLGTAQGDTDLGVIGGTGDVVPDNSTVKGAIEALDTELSDTRDNVDDLITLSGVAENSQDLGAFMAPADFLLTATETIKSALQKIADYLFGIKVTQTTGVTTAVAVDSVAVGTYTRVQWIVEVFETATPANREGFVIDALSDGTSVDDTKYAKLKLGNISGLTSNVVINGANLELQVAATPSCTVNVRRITVV